ncbi:early nodulin-like protein 9 isoform X1 [Vicia villosa]|uniref:early nodulin-like protein 9 isoform X1 n=1 Tax=Vicia villosa TaxID=3911 RepID=UPI00273B5DCC|nr:early nodulin-like protein 9 isoform X1 [Vicia villosa]
MATLIHALAMFCFLALMHKGDSYEFVVGGQQGWSIPSDPNANPFNQWAEKSRFQVGDSLVFNYQSGKDSVIEVNSQQDYENCNTDASGKSSDGHTVIKLDKSGPHYFISGIKDNCLKNEKLLVIVLADRTNRNSNQTATTPSPSPSVPVSPSPSPLSSHTSDALTPSLPPSQLNGSFPPPPSQLNGSFPPPPLQQVGSAPPLGTDVTNPATPTTSPVSEPPPPPNAASSILLSFGWSVGALMVSLLVYSK